MAKASNNEESERIVILKKQVWKDPKSDNRIFKVIGGENKTEATMIGCIHEPTIGGRYKVKGYWRHNSGRNEWQLMISSAQPDFDKSEEGIVNYLKTEAKGIGEVKARELYAIYGSDTINALRDKPELVASTVKISIGAAQAISEHLKSEETCLETKRQLYEIGLTAWEVNTIIGSLGKEAAIKVRENCFQLTSIKGLGWQKVSKIADAMGVAKDDKNRIKAAVMYAVEDLTKGGHVCIYGHEIIDIAQKMIGIQHLNVSSVIEALIEEGTLYSEETDPMKVIEDQQVFQETNLEASLNKLFS